LPCVWGEGDALAQAKRIPAGKQYAGGSGCGRRLVGIGNGFPRDRGELVTNIKVAVIFKESMTGHLDENIKDMVDGIIHSDNMEQAEDGYNLRNLRRLT